MAPMPEDTFFIISACPCGYPDRDCHHSHSKRFSSVATRVTRKSLIASVGETVTVHSLCLDPINMNSV